MKAGTCNILKSICVHSNGEYFRQFQITSEDVEAITLRGLRGGGSGGEVFSDFITEAVLLEVDLSVDDLRFVKYV